MALGFAPLPKVAARRADFTCCGTCAAAEISDYLDPRPIEVIWDGTPATSLELRGAGPCAQLD